MLYPLLVLLSLQFALGSRLIWTFGGYLPTSEVQVLLAGPTPSQIIERNVLSSGGSCETTEVDAIGFYKLSGELPIDFEHTTQIWVWFKCLDYQAIPRFRVSGVLTFRTWTLTGITFSSQLLDPGIRDYLVNDVPTHLPGRLCAPEDAPFLITLYLRGSAVVVTHTYECITWLEWNTTQPIGDSPLWMPVRPDSPPLALYGYTPGTSLLGSFARFSDAQHIPPCLSDSPSAFCSLSETLRSGSQCVWRSIIFTCSSSVRVALQGACGDGQLWPATEECDDGNTLSQDGCSSDCRIESNTQCPKAGFRFVTGRGCIECDTNFFGPQCTPCPSWCVSPRGVCDDGLAGTGHCVCLRGYVGHQCQLCASGFFLRGETCDLCSTSLCSPMGECLADASSAPVCTCQDGWTGRQCDMDSQHSSGRNPVADGTTLRPIECLGAICGPNAECDRMDASYSFVTNIESRLPYVACFCKVGWTGHRCNVCQSGFVGPYCEPCSACRSVGRSRCVEVPPTLQSIGGRYVFLTKDTGRHYVCLDTSRGAQSVPFLTAINTATPDVSQVEFVRPVLDQRSIYWVRVPPSPSSSVCHVFVLHSDASVLLGAQVLADMATNRSTQCPHGAVIWQLETSLVGPVLLRSVSQLLASMRTQLGSTVTQKMHLICVGNNPGCVFASLFSNPLSITDVTWLAMPSKGAQVELGVFTCTPPDSCTMNLCRRADRTALSDGKCQKDCLCTTEGWPDRKSVPEPQLELLGRSCGWNQPPAKSDATVAAIVMCLRNSTAQYRLYPMGKPKLPMMDVDWVSKHSDNRVALLKQWP